MDHKERMGYIGASDVAAILGMSRWSTPLRVWAEKTGELTPDPNDNELPKWWGTEFENTIALRFEKETGKKVRRVNSAHIHKKHDFIRCHVDRLVVGEDAVLQCKMAAAWKAKEWQGEDEVPIEYIAQEQIELACTGKKKAYIAVAVGNTSFIIKEVIRDDKVIAQIVERLVDFWTNYVVPKVMPENILRDDSDTLLKLFPSARAGTIVNLDDEVDRIKESLEALKRDKFNVDSEIKKLENIVKSKIKENEIGLSKKWQVSWGNVHKDSYTVAAQDYRQIRWKLINKEGEE